MKRALFAFSLLIPLLFSFSSLAAERKYSTSNPMYNLEGKAVFGRLEKVFFTDHSENGAIPFIAKIDTGADTTSMHADQIQIRSNVPEFSQLTGTALLKRVVDDLGGIGAGKWRHDYDNKRYQIEVSFDITHPDSGEVLHFDLPLHRISVVRSRSSDEPFYRPVIEIKMRIGKVEAKTDISLTDRGDFSTPVLIGKSFLEENAWVYAGFDYLQEQINAILVGRAETLAVHGTEMDVSFSMKSRHSVMHATNIKLDEENRRVTFTTMGKDKVETLMTLPLAGSVTFGKIKRPQVYIDVEGDNGYRTDMLVYLKDRSQLSTQLRLGTDIQSQNFVLSASQEQLLSQPLEHYQDRIKGARPIVVSPKEIITIDGTDVVAYPDTQVKTSILKVSRFDISEGNRGKQVSYSLPGEDGEPKRYVKQIIRTLKVGDIKRPVISVHLEAGGKYREYEIALETLAKKTDSEPVLVIGRGNSKMGLLINTRAEQLLQPKPLYKAGYIESAEVEGLTFPVKLDTGADISSINALNITRFKQKGKQMVRFDYGNRDGQKHTFTREVVREMSVAAKAGEISNKRPVVMMTIQVGEVSETVEVNLQDRSRFKYSMILGKNFLRNGLVVSSDKQFLLKAESK